MSLRRSGWIDGRPFAQVTDPDTGKPHIWICLVCKGELLADGAVFSTHNCLNYKEVQKPREVRPSAPLPQAPGDDVPFASYAAKTLADEAGLTTLHFIGAEPSSPSGFTKADVEELIAVSEEVEEEQPDVTEGVYLEADIVLSPVNDIPNVEEEDDGLRS